MVWVFVAMAASFAPVVYGMVRLDVVAVAAGFVALTAVVVVGVEHDRRMELARTIADVEDRFAVTVTDGSDAPRAFTIEFDGATHSCSRTHDGRFLVCTDPTGTEHLHTVANAPERSTIPTVD